MAQFIFVFWHHQHDIRNVTHECHIVYPLMCFPVRSNKSGTVNGKHHVGVMSANIMYNLIICTLHECGIHREDRLQAFHSECSTHGRRMLFCYPYVNHAIRKFFTKRNET
ncbi:hypothetical protein D3C74_352580 [compost metagenome]